MKRYLPFLTGILVVAAMFGIGFIINASKPVAGVFASRIPAQGSQAGPNQIRDKINSIKATISNQSLLTSPECVPVFDGLFQEMNNLKLEQFSIAALKPEASVLVQELFNLRILIRENLQKSFLGMSQDLNAKKCAMAHRRLFRSIRVFEDYLGMLADSRLRVPGLNSRKDDKFLKVFNGSNINFLWNEKYRPTQALEYVPKSGDVLLSRGSASVSAAIARITDEDSNFSHAGLVYVDAETGKVETIEAHIEFGTIVADFKEYSDMKARSVVFRFRDPALSDDQNAAIAHDAAKKVRQLVLDYKKNLATKKYPNPCYDFSMDIDNPTDLKPSDDPAQRKCLFCSEVVSLGYSLVAGGKYNIPTFKSPMRPKNRKFLEDIGVTATETFAPADMEIEPYFDMVLEWRDYNRIHKTHVMDAILTAVFSWMDDFSYQFYIPIGKRVNGIVGYGVRRFPLLDHGLGFDLDKKFPLNMGLNAINSTVMLDEVSNRLANVIADKEERSKKDLTPNEMKNLLNAWRQVDADDYSKKGAYETKNDPFQKHRVHHLIRAPKTK